MAVTKGNKYRGEASFEACGKSWSLRLGNNELVQLQDLMEFAEDKEEEFLAELGNIKGPRAVRKRLHQILSLSNPEITPDQVGDIVTELGVPQVGKLIQEALRWCMPDAEPKDGAKEGKGKSASPGSAS